MPAGWREGWAVLATSRPAGHAWRSFFGFISFLLMIYALGLLPLGDVVAISFSSPFWSVLLGMIVFHDKMTWRLALSIAVGFSGVLLIAQPSGSGGFGPGAPRTPSSARGSTASQLEGQQISRRAPPSR